MLWWVTWWEEKNFKISHTECTNFYWTLGKVSGLEKNNDR